eukprot:SAG31_NODE_871_length_11335_cov_4.910822_3_plen_631_part_00
MHRHTSPSCKRLRQVKSHCSARPSAAGESRRSWRPREGTLQEHLDPFPTAAVPDELSSAAAPQLLSDAEVQGFLRDGYIVIEAGGMPHVHAQVVARTDAVLAAEGNPTNNIVARVPETQLALDHPRVRGALDSLLGPGAVLGPHRYVHINKPGSGDGPWHKDCYGAGAWGCDHQLRGPRMSLQWLMGLYYPHDVHLDDGPTAILPRRHIFENVSNDNPNVSTEIEKMLTCRAGTIVLLPFDMWHRVSRNRGSNRRIMLKFHFHRYLQPRESGPSWQFGSPAWQLSSLIDDTCGQSSDEVDAVDAVAQSSWAWLCGRSSAALFGTELTAALQSRSEALRLKASHQQAVLHEHRRVSIDELELLSQRLDAAAATFAEILAWDCEDYIEFRRPPANLHGTNPQCPAVCQALSVIGLPALPLLVRVLAETTAKLNDSRLAHGIGALGKTEWVRCVLALDAIGLMTFAPPETALLQEGVESHVSVVRAVCALTRACSDTPTLYWLRRSTAEALGRISGGAVTQEVLRSLTVFLSDSHRHVRRSAAIALGQLGTDLATLGSGEATLTVVELQRRSIDDEDRYNRYYALVALRRFLKNDLRESAQIASPTTSSPLDQLLHSLLTSRLDPVTIVGNVA